MAPRFNKPQRRNKYPSPDKLAKLIVERGSLAQAAYALGVKPDTLRNYVRAHEEYRTKIEKAISQTERSLKPSPKEEAPLDEDLIRLRKLLDKKDAEYTVEALADRMDAAPKRIRSMLDELRALGFRVPDEETGAIRLHKLVPESHSLHKSLLDGEQVRIGVVSDTHLSSNEQALDELHLAYDMFVEEGITEVLHAGDFTCGRGIFRTQDSEIFNHTYESQVEYLVKNYPKRPGIVTRGITGNHDIEGDFGKIGANPVAALANKRDDIEFLGDYSAWVELPNGAWIHLLHGKGGMSYSFSYKAQKLVDGYPAGRKPAILIPGHWHVSGNIEARSVEVLWPGCFEWKSKFLERLGLSPSVAFHILDLTLGDDGSLVRFTPRKFRFYEGRRAE